MSKERRGTNTGGYEPCFIPMPNSSVDVEQRRINNAVSSAYRRHGLEPARHPLSARFHELLAEAGRTHDAKGADYGLDDDPFANVRASQDWGIPGWVGCMVRATDKVKRLQKFATKGELRNESVKDSFMDLAVYALIGYVLYEEEEA